MKGLKCVTSAAAAGTCLVAGAFRTEAQISVHIGVQPACPDGYYDYARYNCAVYGYYGPDCALAGFRSTIRLSIRLRRFLARTDAPACRRDLRRRKTETVGRGFSRRVYNGSRISPS
jgi:hypothetical protein